MRRETEEKEKRKRREIDNWSSVDGGEERKKASTRERRYRVVCGRPSEVLATSPVKNRSEVD